MNNLCDPAAERAVLSGIYHYGNEVFLDICDMTKSTTFLIDSNKILFACLEHICRSSDNVKIDFPSIVSAAKELSLNHVVERSEEVKHLQSIIKLHVEKQNVRKFAAKLRKLEVARLIHKQGGVLQDKMTELDGTESISNIISIAEGTIFDFTSLLDQSSQVQKLGDSLLDHIKYLEENPVKQVGLSSGYKMYDKAIGGGLRDGTINIIAARSKGGKSIIATNIGNHVAENEKVPVLYMDTEMTQEDHTNRLLAMLSEVPINTIESGSFGQDRAIRDKVYSAGKRASSLSYYHKSIAGMPFEDQLALMRRWIHREVGMNLDGTSKKCLIVYDYLKLMDSDGISGALQEYQLLGFMMTTLHNFAVRYKIPILMTLQLNRDGITKETADAASGSDRIIWLCSNFTILKIKSDEEVAQDGPNAGNRKLVPVLARHGEGLQFGDYINLHMKGWCAKITEGKLRSDANKEELAKEFVVNDEDFSKTEPVLFK